MAPEILKGEQHDQSVDVWAIGILLYELFHNKEPFSGNNPKAVLAKILSFDIKYDSHFPASAKNLVLQILKLDKRKRPNLREILKDPFLIDIAGSNIPMPHDSNSIPISSGQKDLNSQNNKFELRASHNIKPITKFQEPNDYSSNNVYHQSLYRNVQAPNQSSNQMQMPPNHSMAQRQGSVSFNENNRTNQN
jgi:Protein kinase domain